MKIINNYQKRNTNSAITKTETEILECSNNAFLKNCKENNETNLLNMAMGTTTKLSTADSCTKISTSYEHSVPDLGNKIDGLKQLNLESSIFNGDHQRKFNKKLFQLVPYLEYSISKDKVLKYFVLHIEFSRGLGNSEDVLTNVVIPIEKM